MEDIPPSYIQSTNPSILDLVAPYLDTLSLHALTLVSRSYHETFMPYLWGSPASHFVPMAGPTLPGDPDNPQANGSHDDVVYVALTRFKRTLKKARLTTRRLVHTLFLPPALSEIYGGPYTTWLKEILDGLPSLQSLCVGGLPFFDHHSLVAVDRQKGLHTNDEFQTYPLKLLLAAKEPNTTSNGLSLFLPHFPHLVYLDLSYTTPARDIDVLSSLCLQSDLQVLKLRGIGLRDTEAEALANAIGRKVRLLDIAENLLSDMAIRSLLQACFQHSAANTNESRQPHSTTPSRLASSNRQRFESWPVGLPPAPDFLSLDILRSSDFDKNLRVQLTNPLTGRLAFEDIPHAGLTHLYITRNPNVTIEGVRSLLATGKLHVLDAGELANETMVDKYVRNVVDTGRMQDRPPSYHVRSGSIESGRTVSRRHESHDADIHFPGAEKLISVLREKASQNMTYLRIDHAVITKEIDSTREKTLKLTSDAERVSPVELSGQIGVSQLVEIPGTNRQPVELPTHQVFELDATPTVRAELPGDFIHFALTPPIGQRPDQQEQTPEIPKPVKGEGPYAPEAIVNEILAENVALDASGSGGIRPRSTQAVISTVSPMSPHNRTFGTKSSESSGPVSVDAIVESASTPIGTQPRDMSPADKSYGKYVSTPRTAQQAGPDRRSKIDLLIKSRPSAQSSTLSPASLPNLRTLVLTNIPSQVPANSSILPRLKNFITLCALESHLSLLQAGTDYSLPPGRARFEAERKHARSLFALETIVLELVPASQPHSHQRDWKHTRQRLNISKSSTGDHDSETLWSAAENDFSFFGEEGEEQDECGIYDHEPGKYFPRITLDDKFVVAAENAILSEPSTPMSLQGHDVQKHTMQSPSGVVFKSPRELPLGRNRRPSNDSQRVLTPTSDGVASPSTNTLYGNRLGAIEMPGSTPNSNPMVSASTLPFRLQPTGAGSVRGLSPTSSHVPNMNRVWAPEQELAETPMIDVISELSKFRKERKKAYEEAVYKRNFVRVNGVSTQINPLSKPSWSSTGITRAPHANLKPSISISDLEVFVEGHWKGEIKVLRSAGSLHQGQGHGQGNQGQNSNNNSSNSYSHNHNHERGRGGTTNRAAETRTEMIDGGGWGYNNNNDNNMTVMNDEEGGGGGGKIIPQQQQQEHRSSFSVQPPGLISTSTITTTSYNHDRNNSTSGGGGSSSNRNQIGNNGGNNGGGAGGRGRLERNGMVDFYGNYFEKGYLYS